MKNVSYDFFFRDFFFYKKDDRIPLFLSSWNLLARRECEVFDENNPRGSDGNGH